MSRFADLATCPVLDVFALQRAGLLVEEDTGPQPWTCEARRSAPPKPFQLLVRLRNGAGVLELQDPAQRRWRQDIDLRQAADTRGRHRWRFSLEGRDHQILYFRGGEFASRRAHRLYYPSERGRSGAWVEAFSVAQDFYAKQALGCLGGAEAPAEILEAIGRSELAQAALCEQAVLRAVLGIVDKDESDFVDEVPAPPPRRSRQEPAKPSASASISADESEPGEDLDPAAHPQGAVNRQDDPPPQGLKAALGIQRCTAFGEAPVPTSTSHADVDVAPQPLADGDGSPRTPEFRMTPQPQKRAPSWPKPALSRAAADDYPCLTVKWLQEHGMLSPQHSASLNWEWKVERRNQVVAAFWDPEQSSVTWFKDGRKYWLEVERFTEGHGERVMFRCPYLGDRCQSVYLIDGPSAAGRRSISATARRC